MNSKVTGMPDVDADFEDLAGEDWQENYTVTNNHNTNTVLTEQVSTIQTILATGGVPTLQKVENTYILYEAVAGTNTLHFTIPESRATINIILGTALNYAQVDVATFMTQISVSGEYGFQYAFFENSWQYEGVNINLATYGITVTGTPEDSDYIQVSLTTFETASYTFLVNKGDGTSDVEYTMDYQSASTDITLTYEEAGIYTITLKNDIPSIQLATNYNAQKSDALKYKEVYLGKNHDTVIPDYAFTFYGVDSSIETIRKIIAPYVTELRADGIYYCRYLQEYDLRSLTTISDVYTGNYCPVKEIHLPNLVGPNFSSANNTNLLYLNLPKFIGDADIWSKQAFLPKITSIFQFRGSELHIGEDSVTLRSGLYDDDGNSAKNGETMVNFKIYVKKDRVAYYKTATKWSTYADYIYPETSNPIISDTNVVVAVADFVADTTYTGYNFKADITLNGVTADYSGEIIFGLAEAISGNYAPIASTGTDIVTIYAVAVPSADITLPLVKGELL